jgi:hypothetical protein
LWFIEKENTEMQNEVIDFDGVRCARYIRESLTSFMADPPDSLYQLGFLDALLVIYKEAISKEDAISQKCEKISVDCAAALCNK